MVEPHLHRLGVYRRDGESYLIEIKLRDMRQLFNTLDPSPFHEKDLDPAAEEYLVSAVREMGARPCKLMLHLPSQTTGEEGNVVVAAIRHYFSYRARHTSEQLRLLLGRGLISLVIGLLFLFACLSARQLFAALGGSASAAILSEGLLILGWVAMWRPVEIFLYDWWPELGKRRLFTRIASMTIETRLLEPGNGLLVEARAPLASTRVSCEDLTAASHAPYVRAPDVAAAAGALSQTVRHGIHP